MNRELNERDRQWVNALKPYLGGGIVPIWFNGDGTVNAERTIDSFCEFKDAHKLDPVTGEEM